MNTIQKKEIEKILQNNPEFLNEILQNNKLNIIQQQEIYQGPIPHPKILEEYKKIDKNLPKEIIEMAKKEQKFRHISTFLGQFSALTIGIGGLLSTTFLGLYGNAWVAGSIGFLSLGSLVSVFLYNSRKKEND